MFAIGASAWIVILAHEGANPKEPEPTPPTPASEGSPPEELPYEESFDSDAEAEPTFFPSSKSAIGIGPKRKDAADEAKKKKKKPVFLPSSKSMPIREPVHKPAEADK